MNDQIEIKRAAYHEAGHAIFLRHLGLRILSLYIYRCGDYVPGILPKWCGRCKWVPEGRRNNIAEHGKDLGSEALPIGIREEIIAAFAGQCAEELKFGRFDLSDAEEDETQIGSCLERSQFGYTEKIEHRCAYRDECMVFLRNHQGALESLASELEQHHRLGPDLDDPNLNERIQRYLRSGCSDSPSISN